MAAQSSSARELQNTAIARLRVTAPDELLEKLEGLGSLRAGWDSYRAPAPSPRAIQCATALVGDFLPYLLARGCHAELAPSLDGGVRLEVGRREHELSIVVDNGGAIYVIRDDAAAVRIEAPEALKAHLFWLADS